MSLETQGGGAARVALGSGKHKNASRSDGNIIRQSFGRGGRAEMARIEAGEKESGRDDNLKINAESG